MEQHLNHPTDTGTTAPILVITLTLFSLILNAVDIQHLDAITQLFTHALQGLAAMAAICVAYYTIKKKNDDKNLPRKS